MMIQMRSVRVLLRSPMTLECPRNEINHGFSQKTKHSSKKDPTRQNLCIRRLITVRQTDAYFSSIITMFSIARNSANLIGRRATQQIRSKATLHPHDIIKKNNEFKKSWLSDPSTYPIIVVMGCGLTWMVGMGFNALFGYKDVQLNPNNRGAVLKDWSKEHRVGVMERFVNLMGGVAPEGLGIDHDKFVKEKEEYMKK
jgi:hypothetical protein